MAYTLLIDGEEDKGEASLGNHGYMLDKRKALPGYLLLLHSALFLSSLCSFNMTSTFYLVSGSSSSKFEASYTDRASKLKAILDGHLQLLQPDEDQYTMELMAPDCD